MSSAEAIAAVVADLEAGRWQMPDGKEPVLDTLGHAFTAWADARGRHGAVTVDATALYRTIEPSEALIDLYGDHQCIAPPWRMAYLAFENRFGNVIVSQMLADDFKGHRLEPSDRWQTDNEVDWDRVRWVVGAFVWLGGRSSTTGRAIPTTGPVFLERYAIYPDGEPADLNWVRVFDGWDERLSQMHLRVNLGVLNFMNCRNVGIVEPVRPRPERRRIERTGVRVHTINVFPAGKVTRGPRREGEGVPLTSVRGHFGHYGPQYGRGLLFGRYAGRFFRPMHARGTHEHGEVEHDYVLRPERSR